MYRKKTAARPMVWARTNATSCQAFCKVQIETGVAVKRGWFESISGLRQTWATGFQ